MKCLSRRFMNHAGKTCHISSYWNGDNAGSLGESDVPIPYGQSMKIVAQDYPFVEDSNYIQYVEVRVFVGDYVVTSFGASTEWGSSPYVDKEYYNGLQWGFDDIPDSINIDFYEYTWK